MNFKRWDRIVGWSVFAVAAITYLLTMEPSSSLWDCAEFIATSYKLEVGHPPGAPLFMLLARLATMLAPSTHYVPHMVNAMNCICSAFCILFLFWSITHLARRMLTREGEFSESGKLAALAAGAVGALAYTFTDTFWFSAVEGEVYAQSSMFTALVVWLMLKWEEQADEPHSSRWIVLIAYLMGLSIGIHILNLLTIPALVFIYYFRRYKQITLKGVCYATLASLLILGFINGIEPETKPINWMYFFGDDHDFTADDFDTGINIVPTLSALDYPNDWTKESAAYIDENLNTVISDILSAIDGEYSDFADLVNGEFNLYSTETVQELADSIKKLFVDFDEKLFEAAKVVLDVDLKALSEYTAPEGIDTSAEFAAALTEMLGCVPGLIDWIFLGEDFRFFTGTKKDEQGN